MKSKIFNLQSKISSFPRVIIQHTPEEVTAMRNWLLVERFGNLARILAGLLLWVGLAGVAASAAPDTAITGQPEVPAGLTDTEKQNILKENNPKDRVETCMKVSANRLTQVVEAIKREEFENAAKTIGVYESLLCYTNTFATKADIKAKKRDNLYRIIETGLRKQMPFLEWASREMPECHEQCACRALNRAKEIRRVALNAMFGGEFLKDETAPSEGQERGGN